MKRLILYKTKCGTAYQYAVWLKDEFPDTENFSVETFDNNFVEYDPIIIISCTYMGDISAREYLEQIWKKIKTKYVYLVAVGLVFNGNAKKTFEKIPENIRKSIGYIKIPGRIQFDRLSDDEKEIIRTLKGEFREDIDRKNLEPVISYIRELESTQSLIHGIVG